MLKSVTVSFEGHMTFLHQYFHIVVVFFVNICVNNIHSSDGWVTAIVISIGKRMLI